jgi:hypothetical protein
MITFVNKKVLYGFAVNLCLAITYAECKKRRHLSSVFWETFLRLLISSTDPAWWTRYVWLEFNSTWKHLYLNVPINVRPLKKVSAKRDKSHSQKFIQTYCDWARQNVIHRALVMRFKSRLLVAWIPADQISDKVAHQFRGNE